MITLIQSKYGVVNVGTPLAGRTRFEMNDVVVLSASEYLALPTSTKDLFTPKMDDGYYSAIYGPFVVGDQGTKHRMLACAIRNVGAPDYWQLIDNTGHKPIGVDHVVTDTTKISIYYNFTAAIVGSVVVSPDETMSGLGFMAGASVEADHCEIKLMRRRTIGDYISYSGSAWSSQSGIFTGITFSAGVLTVNHDAMFGYGVSVTGRGIEARVSVAGTAIAPTATKIEFYDAAGALITTPNANMKVYVGRTDSSSTGVLNPQTAIDITTEPLHNLWIYGVHPVAS